MKRCNGICKGRCNKLEFCEVPYQIPLNLQRILDKLKQPLKKSIHGLFQFAVFENKFSNTFQINALRF